MDAGASEWVRVWGVVRSDVLMILISRPINVTGRNQMLMQRPPPAQHFADSYPPQDVYWGGHATPPSAQPHFASSQGSNWPATVPNPVAPTQFSFTLRKSDPPPRAEDANSSPPADVERNVRGKGEATSKSGLKRGGK